MVKIAKVALLIQVVVCVLVVASILKPLVVATSHVVALEKAHTDAADESSKADLKAAAKWADGVRTAMLIVGGSCVLLAASGCLSFSALSNAGCTVNPSVGTEAHETEGKR